MQSPPPGATLLGVWAHPDDETFLSAGIMAAAVDQGSRVVCVTATRGELGSSDPTRWPSGPQLAEVRTAELMEALSVLGVTEHHWLDYPDGGCPEADSAEAISRLTAMINDVRPDAILTFGPDGMTGHADHRTVSGWVSESRKRSAVAAQVFHAIHTDEWLDQFKPALDEVGAFMGFHPPSVHREQADIGVVLDGAALDRKLAALTAQVSQTESLFAALGPALARDALAEEVFVHG